MMRPGLLFLLGAAVFSLCSPKPGSAAPPSQKPKAETRKSSKNAFGIKQFGPGSDMTPDPAQADYQETGARHGGHTRDGTPPHVETPPPEREPRREAGPLKPKGPQFTAPVEDGRFAAPVDSAPNAPRVPADAGFRIPVGPSGSPDVKDSPGAGKKGAPESVAAEAEKEELRDALAAPRNPRMFSLWAGLSTPLLLPSAKVQKVSPASAKTLGRTDYESHILGRRSSAKGGRTTGPVDGVSGAGSLRPAAASIGDIGGTPDRGKTLWSGPARGGDPGADGRGMFVSVEVDVSDTPGVFRDALAEVTRETGLRMDDRFPPVFMNPGKTAVLVRGWLKAERISDALASPRVARLESPRSSGRPKLRTQAVSDLLLGLRIPPQSSPSAALKAALDRLSADTGFTHKETIGYQRVPGTSEMVLIVAGRVPVAKMSRLMADPAVVKIVPSPREEAASRPVKKRPPLTIRRFVSFVVNRHPGLLIVSLALLTFLIGHAASRKQG